MKLIECNQLTTNIVYNIDLFKFNQNTISFLYLAKLILGIQLQSVKRDFLLPKVIRFSIEWFLHYKMRCLNYAVEILL